MKRNPRGSIAKYAAFLQEKVEDFTRFETPMALYQWLLRNWRGTIRDDSLSQAYQAAWAVFIDRGLVKL